MMMDWFILLLGAIQWLIIIIALLFIHDFTLMYQEMVLSASVFTIFGTVIYAIFHYTERNK